MNVVLKKKALKFLKSLKVKDDIRRISEKIEQLSINPFPPDSKRIEGFSIKVFRIRVGHYRILYFMENSIVYIEKIDYRERVYDS